MEKDIYIYIYMSVLVAQSCLTLCDPVVCSPLCFSVHGISRQEYWSGLPFPSPYMCLCVCVCVCVCVYIYHFVVYLELTQPVNQQYWNTNKYKIKDIYCIKWASQVAQWVKNPPAMQEMQVGSLGWEDPRVEGMATHSSILAWRIPWTEKLGGL